MIELIVGLGVVYTLYKSLNALDDVGRLADKIAKLEAGSDQTKHS